MKATFKAKVQKGICFNEKREQFKSAQMIKAPKLKKCHLIKEVDFSNLSNSSRLDRLFGCIPTANIEKMANSALLKMFPEGRIDLNDSRVKVISSGFLAKVEIQIA